MASNCGWLFNTLIPGNIFAKFSRNSSRVADVSNTSYFVLFDSNSFCNCTSFIDIVERNKSFLNCTYIFAGLGSPVVASRSPSLSLSPNKSLY